MSYPKPLHWWVDNVLPLVYDGSLSYYEVISKVTEYINGLTADMTEVKSQIENIDAIIDTLDPERIETLLTEVDTLATAVNGMEGRVGTLEDDNSDNKQNINTLNGLVSNLQSNVSALGTNVENFGSRLGNVEEQVSDYNERISNAENLAQTASSNTAALGIRVNEAEAKIEDVEDKADNYGNAIAQSEDWYTATRSYVPHDLVFVGGTLYEVISNITSGDSLTIGSNIKAVTISENNKEIKNAINEIESNLESLNPDVAQNSEDIENLKTDTNSLKRAINDPAAGLGTKAPIIINSASGEFVHFTDGADSMPVKTLTISSVESAIVTRAGKNVLNNINPTILNGYFATATIQESVNQRIVILPCIPNTTYSFTWNRVPISGNQTSRVVAFTSDPTYGSSGNIMAASVAENGTATFTTGANDMFLAIHMGDIRTTDFAASLTASMLEISSAATSYEPYQATTFVYPSETVTTLLGVNNIWSDAGSVDVSYCADTKLYINNKIAELQALVLENMGG